MKTKQITLESGTYTIKEPTVGILFPILDLMEKDPKGFQMGLVKGSIFKADGTPLGDGILELGLSEYMTLMQEVIEVAGLGNEQGKL
jgi:hypothetical protein